MGAIREQAISEVEAMVARAEGVLNGAVAYDPECGTPRVYARRLAAGAEANIHFCIKLGLFHLTDDREMLFGWGRRLGEVNRQCMPEDGEEPG